MKNIFLENPPLVDMGIPSKETIDSQIPFQHEVVSMILLEHTAIETIESPSLLSCK